MLAIANNRLRIAKVALSTAFIRDVMQVASGHVNRANRAKHMADRLAYTAEAMCGCAHRHTYNHSRGRCVISGAIKSGWFFAARMKPS